MSRFIWIGIAGFLFSLTANAKLFSNSYVSFDLPPDWDCKREGTEWLCISQFSAKAKEAIIILTAKEVGPTDTLAQYMAHLKEPRSLPANKGGPPTPSKVLHVQQRNINNHPWVDGLHLGSEVTTYYTRYLGTVKDRIAILVTFSAHRSHYTKYSNDFIRAIESLRVTATKELMPRAAAPQTKPTGHIGTPIATGNTDFETFPGEDSTGGAAGLRKLLGLALILAAVGLLIFMRSRKKRKR
jgi:hypothetical protein